MAVYREVLATTAIIALCAGAPHCYAQANTQTDPPASGEAAPTTDIVVPGRRESEAESIDIKRRSPQIMDSIVAEDIGKLPDQNVAESLERVSGVQVRRELDEAADIKIGRLTQNRLECSGQ